MKNLIFSRPHKLGDFDTVVYEIDMLRFAAARLQESNWQDPRDAWVYLEAFLVHYRNLIEFLGKDNPSKTDLHITTMWNQEGVAAPVDVDEIHTKGKQLWAQYEPKDTDGGGRISQYLHHCTTKRTNAKYWRIDEMTKQIEPLLKSVEPHFRGKPFLKPVFPVEFSGPFAASTTVATHTAVLQPWEEGLNNVPVAPLKKRPEDK
ncbi:MAG: hypothetical protein ACHQT6_01310 [Candidatus Acidiferrales bacterium]